MINIAQSAWLLFSVEPLKGSFSFYCTYRTNIIPLVLVSERDWVLAYVQESSAYLNWRFFLFLIKLRCPNTSFLLCLCLYLYLCHYLSLSLLYSFFQSWLFTVHSYLSLFKLVPKLKSQRNTSSFTWNKWTLTERERERAPHLSRRYKSAIHGSSLPWTFQQSRPCSILATRLFMLRLLHCQ